MRFKEKSHLRVSEVKGEAARDKRSCSKVPRRSNEDVQERWLSRQGSPKQTKQPYVTVAASRREDNACRQIFKGQVAVVRG